MEIITVTDGNPQLVGMSCDRCHHAVFEDDLENSYAMDHFIRIYTNQFGGPLLEIDDKGSRACDLCEPCAIELLGAFVKPIDVTAPGFAYHPHAGPRMQLDAYLAWRKSIRLPVVND